MKYITLILKVDADNIMEEKIHKKLQALRIRYIALSQYKEENKLHYKVYNEITLEMLNIEYTEKILEDILNEN